MDYKLVKSLFEAPRKVVITTHRSPDADAIGSSLALHNVLLRLGHSSKVIVPDAFPSFLAWMKGAEDILIHDQSAPECEAQIEEAELIFSLDYNSLSRVAAVGDLISNSSATKILIDHHIDPATFDHMLSDTSASSTAQLVYDFVAVLGWEEHIDEEIAACLYAGIMTDTGSFKFPSTSAHTHEVTAKLMERGLNAFEVHHQIFDTNSFDRLKLIGYALSEKLEFNAERGFAIISLSHKEKMRFNFKKGDTEGLVNYGLSIQGSKLAVFLSEEPGFTKMSFRSTGDLDVNVIARSHFNGGGHKNAAGGKLDLDLEPALMELKNVLESIDI